MLRWQEEVEKSRVLEASLEMKKGMAVLLDSNGFVIGSLPKNPSRQYIYIKQTTQ
jgi:hypothetical protein